jgi:hypothetical protein
LSYYSKPAILPYVLFLVTVAMLVGARHHRTWRRRTPSDGNSSPDPPFGSGELIKRTRKSIKNQFLFSKSLSTYLPVGIEIVPPFSTTVQPSASSQAVQHHCTTFGFVSGCTEVLQAGTISMPTDRHVDNLYHPRLDKNVGFWLVDDPLVQNPCDRLVVT